MKSFRTLLAMVCLSLCLGCAAFSTVLQDVSATVTRFAPLLGVAEGVVCVISGPGCAAVSAFVNVAEPEAVQLASAFTAWSNASATAQPGHLNQVIAALTTWQAQLKAGLAIPGLSTAQQQQYDPMIEAELNASADLLTTLQLAMTNGGTTQALAKVIDEAEPLEPSNSADYLAFWQPGKVFRIIRAPRTFKLKNGAVVHTWAYHKSRLLERMGRPTGDARVDLWRSRCIEQVKKLG